MVINMAAKLLLVFSTGLISDYVLAGVVINRNNTVHGWNVLIGKKNFNIFGECKGLFINRHVFITDAECFNYMLREGDVDRIYFSNQNSKNSVYTVDKDNIYYNEDLSEIYDRNKRQIIVLMSKNPITEDYIDLHSNISDINSQKCYVFNDQDSQLDLSPCKTTTFKYISNDDIHDPAFVCSWTDLTMISGNAVICDSKENPQKKIFLGLLSTHRNLSDDEAVLIGVENVTDLRDIIDKKLSELL
ncbi:uncharacterized protein LOC130667060 [Microplitis mediator]|uniref:uncharacterized protein LOC130667060 n=1 Tax=Microplitis mediator TaxID=375433 RepID=UPI002554711E|nr:uncharacterized protein LOC130667060 [Microplitis mediator]